MTLVLLASVLLTTIVMALTLLVMVARRIMLPSAPVEITINDTRQIAGTTGQKLLTILKAADIPVPSGCAGVGTCGLCRVQVPQGGGAPLPTETARLSHADIRAGVRLACQVVVRAPLAIKLPEDILGSETMACTVVTTRMLAPLIREIILRAPQDTTFTPRAGAFVQIEAPAYALDFSSIDVADSFAPVWDRLAWRKLSVRSAAPVSRAYSLANRPKDTGLIVLTIRLALPPAGTTVPPGLVSSWLFALRPGDTVQASGPYGDFGADIKADEIVLIGGGVGMAPLRAIVHDQIARAAPGRKISYWYGARSQADAFYLEEFKALAKGNPNFMFHLALSDPAPGDTGEASTGFIHDVVLGQYLKDHPAPEACEYYLCGPPLMIRAVRRMLDDLGVEDDMIFYDDFGS